MNAISEEEVTVARGEYRVARERRAASAAAFDGLVAQHQREAAELDRSSAAIATDLATAEAALPLAERWLEDTVVRAPIDGVS